MLSSPRRPSSTMRIFSSAEWCRRVALRISRTVFSALSGMRLLACLIVAPQRGYDEPAILSYAISSFCPTSADGLHLSGQLLLGKLSETVVVVSNAPHNRPCGLVCHLIGNRASFLCTSQKRTFCKASHQLMGEMFRRSSSAVETSR